MGQFSQGKYSTFFCCQVETARSILLVSEHEEQTASLLAKIKQLRLDPAYGQRAMAGLQLCHLEGLLGFLTLLRARWMLKNKQDPFNVIDTDYQNNLDDPEGIVLESLKNQGRVDVVLYKVHRFIMSR